MNETIKIMNGRKSVRVFEERAIEPEKKAAIINAAKRAPTAGNMMLYSIIDVTDRRILEELAVTCDNQPFIATAKMALIFVADYVKWYDRYAKLHGGEVRELGMGDLLLCCQDAVIAAQNAAIAAESLGIGSCYIGDIIENFERHKELFALPPRTAPISMLVFGYPTEQQKERALTPRFDDKIVVFENKYHELSREESLEFKSDELIERNYTLKFAADFSLEMNRSAELIYKNWCNK